MVDIKDEVEALIGPIDLLDQDPQDDGFLTFWAEQIVAGNMTVNEVETLLADMAYLKPVIDRAINRTLDPTDDNDSGILSFWAGEVTRIMNDEGLTHQEALLQVEQIIKDTYNLGEVTFYMTDDEVIFFDNNGNILYTYVAPDDPNGWEYAPQFVLISEDDSKAIIIIGKSPDPLDDDLYNYLARGFMTIEIDLINKTENDLSAIIGEESNRWPTEVFLTGDNKYLALVYYSIDNAWDGTNVGYFRNGHIIFFDLENKTIINEVWAGGSQVEPPPFGANGIAEPYDAILSPDGTRLYMSAGSRVTIFDMGTGLELAFIEDHGKSLYISDDGKILSIIRFDDTEVKYNVADLDNIYQVEDIPSEIMEALIPYVEPLIGADFDQENGEHMGFLSYWAERADSEGLQSIKDLLSAMAAVLANVESLIGNIDLFDEHDPGNGFLAS